eukprot:SAG31_NODE_2310_length_5960_cov_5.846613_4_plen_348_part_00
MRRNVIWRTTGVMVKGTQHRIERNNVFGTGFGSGTSTGGVDDEGSTISDITMYHAHDEGTCQCDRDYCIHSNVHSEGNVSMCCVDGINATFEGLENNITGNALEAYRDSLGGGIAVQSTIAVDAAFNIPGRAVNNSAGFLFEQLRDPHNWDFRPRPGNVFAVGQIGAYDAVEAGGSYTIPGRIEYRASTPIPPHDSTGVKIDADLMFLPAHGASGHRIFVNCSAELVQHAADMALTASAPLDVVAETNIFTPPPSLMQRSQKLFWRVDAIMPSGVTYTGEMWSFTIEAPPPPPPPPPSPCSWTYSQNNPTPIVDGGWTENQPSSARQSLLLSVPRYPPGWNLTNVRL